MRRTRRLVAIRRLRRRMIRLTTSRFLRILHYHASTLSQTRSYPCSLPSVSHSGFQPPLLQPEPTEAPTIQHHSRRMLRGLSHAQTCESTSTPYTLSREKHPRDSTPTSLRVPAASVHRASPDDHEVPGAPKRTGPRVLELELGLGLVLVCDAQSRSDCWQENLS